MAFVGTFFFFFIFLAPISIESNITAETAIIPNNNRIIKWMELQGFLLVWRWLDIFFFVVENYQFHDGNENLSF